MSANPFESGARKCIPAVLVYARNRGEVLMIRKGAGPGGDLKDGHAGKCNGLGGKAEPDESPLETAVREFSEESGVLADPMWFRALGAVIFPNFKPHKGEDWWVTLWEVELPEAARAGIPAATDEGSLEWVAEGRLLELPLWEGDRLFLSHVLKREPVLATLWYREGRVERSWVQRI
ncbi:MAG: NUDIX domain-containing protein [Bdellovibrionales bacterium]|nr:NUDIX domain-containing protein [Bdellovibrionales bacterium]